MSEVITRPVVDRATGKIAIERVQDVEDIIERNKQRQNERQDTRNGWHMLAEIPNIMIEKWIVEDGVSYRELMSPDGMERIIKRKLRDPDYAWLRATDRKF